MGRNGQNNSLKPSRDQCVASLKWRTRFKCYQNLKLQTLLLYNIIRCMAIFCQCYFYCRLAKLLNDLAYGVDKIYSAAIRCKLLHIFLRTDFPDQ